MNSSTQVPCACCCCHIFFLLMCVRFWRWVSLCCVKPSGMISTTWTGVGGRWRSSADVCSCTSMEESTGVGGYWQVFGGIGGIGSRKESGECLRVSNVVSGCWGNEHSTCTAPHGTLRSQVYPWEIKSGTHQKDIQTHLCFWQDRVKKEKKGLSDLLEWWSQRSNSFFSKIPIL